MVASTDPQAIAIDALCFIAGDEERLSRFIALTGITPSLLREAATDPGFLAGVLDHVMADETLLLAFSDHSGIAPALIATAHQTLLPPPGDWDA